MWRYRLLKGYALAVGAGSLLLGVLGVLPAPPPHPEHPEYFLHIGAGVLFLAGGLLLDDLDQLRGFVGTLGALLVIGKGVIVGVRSLGVHPFFLPGVGYVCLVIGVCSVLVSLFVPRGRAG